VIKMCCVCHKVEADGQWSAGRCLGEKEQVTHGYCPECYAVVMTEIERFIGVKASCALGAPAWSAGYGAGRPCV
jgi:hypothetical protein